MQINNPFIAYESRDNVHKDKTNYQLSKLFNYHIYILCLKNDYKHDDNIFNKKVDKSLLDNYTLVRVRINTFMHLRENFWIISGNTLNKFFSNNFLDNEIILPLYYLNKDHIKNLLKLENGITTMQESMNLLNILDYIQKEYLNSTQYLNFCNMIFNSNDGMYWANQTNCKQNITLFFIERTFKLSDFAKITDEEIRKIVQKIDTEGDNDNYLSFLYRKKLYVDVSSGLKKKGYKLYNITQNPLTEKLNNTSFTNIINKLIDNKQYKIMLYLLLTVMKSKELCHLVVNNVEILKLMNKKIDYFGNSIFNRFMPIIHYILRYVWITFYTEEAIKNSYSKKTDRYIMTADTASLLPVFPYDNSDYRTSPYLPILVMKNIVNIEQNLQGVGMIYKDNKFPYGISTKEEFEEKLNIFMTKDPNVKIFENFEWNKYNYAISGSVMTACAIKKNPLEYLHASFNEYLDTYYKTSDLDIMSSYHNFDFVDATHYLVNTLKKNIKKNYNVDAIVFLVPAKTVNIIFDITYATENIVDDNITLEDVIKDLNQAKIKDKVYKIYLKEKLKMIQANKDTKYWDNEIYNDVFDIVPIEKISIVLLNKEKNKFSYTENLKYKISTEFITRSIELFSVYGFDHFTVVAKFHLPCVRAYYNGDNVYMTPSFISAAMTFMNIDYKFFSGSYHPCELILKYHTRGFGLYLNDHEKVKFVNYACSVHKWKKELNIDILQPTTINKIFGSKTIYHPFYNKKNIQNTTSISISWIYILTKLYRQNESNEFNTTVYNTNSINNEGYIIPMKNHLINYCIEEL